MKIACIGLDSKYANTKANYERATQKIEESLSLSPDTIVLPELFTTGFFPKNIDKFADKNGEQTKEIFSSLAKKHTINIVAGSVATQKNGSIYNTSYIFNKAGEIVGEYDKTHLFTYMNEERYFAFGDHISTFILDGKKCGIIICYDLRFGELVRTLALEGIELLFMVSAWPLSRLDHLRTLLLARAIENQIYVTLCNSTTTANDIKFGGNSMIIDPYGKELARGDENEHIISATLDFSLIEEIRNGINIYKDRKPQLYKIKG